MAPATIAEYLVEFDAELQARLGRRRRIVVEVQDHLREAAAAGLKQGLTQAEAEAAATSAFGEPTAVAEGFGADALARTTSRLVIVGQSVDAWMAQHPWRGAALAAAVPSMMYFIAATVGVILNRMPAYTIPVSALSPFPLTFLFWGRYASGLRDRPEQGLWARATAVGKQGVFRFQYLWWLGAPSLSLYHEMGGGYDVWNDHRFFLLFIGLTIAGQVLTWIAGTAIRKWRRAVTGSDDWTSDHPCPDGLPGYSVALPFAWMVILAYDARSPLSVRLATAAVVFSFALVFWLYRGSVASAKRRAAFHYALVSSIRRRSAWS